MSALKKLLKVILSVFGMGIFIASLKNGKFEIIPFFFLIAVLLGCYVLILYCYSKAKLKIKTRNINKEYTALKNLNAIE